MTLMNLPVHPMIVHFPIALYFLELVLVAFWFFKRDEAYRRFARFTFRVAYLFMLVALVTGWLSAGGFESIRQHEAVRLHFVAAVTVFVYYTFHGLYWRFGKPEKKMYAVTLLLQVLMGYSVVVLTAYFGGNLVYG